MTAIFGEEGARILHLSGVIAALSPDASRFCLEVTRAAKRHGTRISFDLNYRASFWEGRGQELRAIFTEIAAAADILVGNEEDFQLALGIAGPEAGGDAVASKVDSFKEMIGRVGEAYPNASYFANTLREVINTNRHMWGALMFADGAFHVAEPREIGVLDRIGGGDGFVGGMLYGVLRGWQPEQLPAVRMGHRRACRHVADRLRHPGRRGTGLEHLGRQRARQTVITRGTRSR